MMQVFFRKVIWAAMKAVVGQGDLRTGHKQRPLSPVFKFLSPRLGNPFLSHFMSLGFLPMLLSSSPEQGG